MQSSKRNNKRKNHSRNNNNRVVHNAPVTPKVTVGFYPNHKPSIKTWPPLNNEKEFPSLDTKGDAYLPLETERVILPPLILSPIDQVLGCLSYDSNIPPPELLIQKVKKQNVKELLQFDPESDPFDVSLNELLKVTEKVHQNQWDIIYTLVQLKKKQNIPTDFLLKNLIDFVNESKFLVTLCKHVK